MAVNGLTNEPGAAGGEFTSAEWACRSYIFRTFKRDLSGAVRSNVRSNVRSIGLKHHYNSNVTNRIPQIPSASHPNLVARVVSKYTAIFLTRCSNPLMHEDRPNNNRISLHDRAHPLVPAPPRLLHVQLPAPIPAPRLLCVVAPVQCVLAKLRYRSPRSSSSRPPCRRLSPAGTATVSPNRRSESNTQFTPLESHSLFTPNTPLVSIGATRPSPTSTSAALPRSW